MTPDFYHSQYLVISAILAMLSIILDTPPKVRVPLILSIRIIIRIGIGGITDHRGVPAVQAAKGHLDCSPPEIRARPQEI